MASMPKIVTEMDLYSSSNSHEAAATHDDRDAMDISKVHPSGSSLAVAAAKPVATTNLNRVPIEARNSRRRKKPSNLFQRRQAKRSNTISDTVTTVESTAMETSTEDHATIDTEMLPTSENPLRKKDHELDDVSTDIKNAENTSDEFFGVKSLHPIQPCDVTDPIVENHPPRASSNSNNRRKNTRKTKEQKISATTPSAQDTPNYQLPKSVECSVRIEVRWAPNDFH